MKNFNFLKKYCVFLIPVPCRRMSIQTYILYYRQLKLEYLILANPALKYYTFLIPNPGGGGNTAIFVLYIFVHSLFE